MAKLESGSWTSRLIWQIELSWVASSLTLALRDTKATEEAPSLGTGCYSRTLKVISLDRSRWMAEIFVLSWHCWGSPLRVQWRQMSTNAGWFGGRSVPSLKWTQARGPSGWTGCCPWALGWLELCVFRDEGEGWDAPTVRFIICTEQERWCTTGAFLQHLVPWIDSVRVGRAGDGPYEWQDARTESMVMGLPAGCDYMWNCSLWRTQIRRMNKKEKYSCNQSQ